MLDNSFNSFIIKIIGDFKATLKHFILVIIIFIHYHNNKVKKKNEYYYYYYCYYDYLILSSLNSKENKSISLLFFPLSYF